MTNSYKDVFINAIKNYGEESQLMMAIEEMSELTKEICKHFRGESNYEAISEEMADVYIMLAQMQIMFFNEDDVRKYVAQKVNRLKKRLSKT